jgi:iron complex outermembrane receptor protein
MRYKLDWQSQNEKVRVFSQLRYVAPQNRIAKDFGEIKTADFTVMDIGASYQLIEKLKINIAINNIWDQKYREHLNRIIPSFILWSPGRNCMIQMTYQW